MTNKNRSGVPDRSGKKGGVKCIPNTATKLAALSTQHLMKPTKMIRK